ncbi:MAG: hypothetical protein GX270_02355 [Clostridiaceae bacterium]|nr:hypothetical protein [Clostridiaceae bacterium]
MLIITSTSLAFAESITYFNQNSSTGWKMNESYLHAGTTSFTYKYINSDIKDRYQGVFNNGKNMWAGLAAFVNKNLTPSLINF